MFTFRQFTIHDEQCAMKVGTDGTLLGAWSPLPLSGAILDVGTGSGLIALMLAQRCPQARITAIDIDSQAVNQAEANFQASPWSNRLTAIHSTMQQARGEYQLIVSNPPYFVNSLKNPDSGRQMARHTDTLPYSALLQHAARLLTNDGVLSLILPAEAESSILTLAQDNQLTPFHITRVHTREGKPAKRVLMAFTKSSQPQPLLTDTLCLIGKDGAPRSPQYQDLCKEFYL